jgi:hypothetical protein
MILGIAAFVTCGLSAPFAVWLARKASNEIRASNGTQGGEGMAQAGLILGIIGLVIMALGVLWFVWVFVRILFLTTRVY